MGQLLPYLSHCYYLPKLPQHSPSKWLFSTTATFHRLTISPHLLDKLSLYIHLELLHLEVYKIVDHTLYALHSLLYLLHHLVSLLSSWYPYQGPLFANKSLSVLKINICINRWCSYCSITSFYSFRPDILRGMTNRVIELAFGVNVAHIHPIRAIITNTLLMSI